MPRKGYAKRLVQAHKPRQFGQGCAEDRRQLRGHDDVPTDALAFQRLEALAQDRQAVVGRNDDAEEHRGRRGDGGRLPRSCT